MDPVIGPAAVRAEPLAQLRHIGFGVEQEVRISLTQKVAPERTVPGSAASEVVANVAEFFVRALAVGRSWGADDRVNSGNTGGRGSLATRCEWLGMHGWRHGLR